MKFGCFGQAAHDGAHHFLSHAATAFRLENLDVAQGLELSRLVNIHRQNAHVGPIPGRRGVQALGPRLGELSGVAQLEVDAGYRAARLPNIQTRLAQHHVGALECRAHGGHDGLERGRRRGAAAEHHLVVRVSRRGRSGGGALLLLQLRQHRLVGSPRGFELGFLRPGAGVGHGFQLRGLLLGAVEVALQPVHFVHSAVQQVFDHAHHALRRIRWLVDEDFLLQGHLAIAQQRHIEQRATVLGQLTLHLHLIPGNGAKRLHDFISDGVNDVLTQRRRQLGASAVICAVEGPPDGLNIAARLGERLRNCRTALEGLTVDFDGDGRGLADDLPFVVGAFNLGFRLVAQIGLRLSGVGIDLPVNLHLELGRVVHQVREVFVGLGSIRFGLFKPTGQVGQVVLHTAPAADEVVSLGLEAAALLLQLLDIVPDLDFLQEVDVAGRGRLHFAGAQLHVLEGVVDFAADLTGPELINHLQLGLLHLPHAHVQRVLGHVGKDFDFKAWDFGHQDVALTLNAPFTLLNVRRPPRHVEVMQRHQPLLHVGAGAQLLGGAQQHAHLASVHLAEQVGFLVIRVVVVDEGDFVLWDALFDERGLEIVVHAEPAKSRLNSAQPVLAFGVQLGLGGFHVLHDAHGGLVAKRRVGGHVFAAGLNARLQGFVLLQLGLGVLDGRAHVREHQLGALPFVVLVVTLQHAVAGRVDAAAFVPFGGLWIHQSDVHGGLAGVAHHHEDVVVALFRRAAAFLDGLRPFGDFRHVVVLCLGLVQRYRRAATALQFGQRECGAVVFLGVGLLDVIHRHRVGDLVEHL
ncbi:hypothetical protein D9M73_62680 [compost metagenome]